MTSKAKKEVPKRLKGPLTSKAHSQLAPTESTSELKGPNRREYLCFFSFFEMTTKNLTLNMENKKNAKIDGRNF